MMRSADHILDIGPAAGELGGRVMYEGDFNGLLADETSLTARYLRGDAEIKEPRQRRTMQKRRMVIQGAAEHNLKSIDVEIPLDMLVCITGVSGSGKSTLVKHILYPALLKALGKSSNKTGDFDGLDGDLKRLADVEMIDQNPIGRSSRSNPATYVKAFDFIRDLFAKQQLAKMRGLKAGFFSYNVPGGRCEVCKGDGEITISMQFMADVQLQCEECKGKRYTPETLEVEYHGKNINDGLNLSIDEAIVFFDGKTGLEQKIVERIKPLAELGLGYLNLGQSSSTLSGGEAQRIKLASFLTIGQKNPAPTLFIFDEPTTGLHFHDIDKLLIGFQELIKFGHSILVIEHNMEIIKSADWIIDLGPEGGEKKGGTLMFEGTPEEMIKKGKGFTAEFLKKKLS
jgi:excinuclease ABC subunit A